MPEVMPSAPRIQRVIQEQPNLRKVIGGETRSSSVLSETVLGKGSHGSPTVGHFYRMKCLLLPVLTIHCVVFLAAVTAAMAIVVFQIRTYTSSDCKAAPPHWICPKERRVMRKRAKRLIARPIKGILGLQ